MIHKDILFQKNSLHNGEWQLCPKCNGQGSVSKPPYVAGDVSHWTAGQSSFECDVCNGKKIIERPLPKQDETEIDKTWNEVAATISGVDGVSFHFYPWLLEELKSKFIILKNRLDKDVLLKGNTEDFIKKLKLDIEKMYEEEFKLRKLLSDLIKYSKPYSTGLWNFEVAIERAELFLNSEQEVQESDTTKLNQGEDAGNKI